MPDQQEQWAVFWCSLLSPLLYGEIPPEEAGRFLRQLASTEQVFLDNAKIYHANALKAACFALNIRLIHRGVGDPPWTTPRR